MAISHKKINDIKLKIDDIIKNELDRELLINFIKETLNYDEEFGTYKKDRYETYSKQYIDKNRIKINIQKAENAKKRYHEKKLEKLKKKNLNSIEDQFNNIQI